MAGARWVRLDVEYFGNPKVRAVPKDARLLHLASICWSARYLTDGHIPEHIVPDLLHDAGVRATVVHRLVAAGLWHLNVAGGYQIHDYFEHQPSASSVQKRREEWRKAQKKHRNGSDMSSDDSDYDSTLSHSHNVT